MNPQIEKTFEETIPENREIIPLEPLCDFFEINFQRQVENLRTHPGISPEMSLQTIPDFFNDRRKRICLTKKGFLKWVLQLNFKTVKKELQDQFLEYQDNLINFLYDSTLQREQMLSQRVKDKLEADRLEESLRKNNPEFQRLLELRRSISETARSISTMDRTYEKKQLSMFSEEDMKG